MPRRARPPRTRPRPRPRAAGNRTPRPPAIAAARARSPLPKPTRTIGTRSSARRKNDSHREQLSSTQAADELDDRRRQCAQLLLADRERRREIDDRSERPHEHAFIDEPPAQRIEIVDAVELAHPDGPFYPHLLDPRQAAARREAARELLRDRPHLLQARLPPRNKRGRRGAPA